MNKFLLQKDGEKWLIWNTKEFGDTWERCVCFYKDVNNSSILAPSKNLSWIHHSVSAPFKGKL